LPEYPLLEALLNGHQYLTLQLLSSTNLPLVEERLKRLASLRTTYDSLVEKFRTDVRTVAEYLAFTFELRFAGLLCRVARDVEFIMAKRKASTPDLSGEIGRARIQFEVTTIRDPEVSIPRDGKLTTRRLDMIVQDFHRKTQSKLSQATKVGGTFVLVVEAQPAWNAGFVLDQIASDLQNDVADYLPSYSNVSALVLLYPETISMATRGRSISRNEGIVVVNRNANSPLDQQTERELLRMLEPSSESV
jgi:hypothetical protein